MKKMEDITMKGTLTYKLPEESEEFSTALNGWKYKHAMEEVWQKVFRPYFKHGYGSEELNRLVETEDGGKIVEALSELYLSVAKELPDRE